MTRAADVIVLLASVTAFFGVTGRAACAASKGGVAGLAAAAFLRSADAGNVNGAVLAVHGGNLAAG